MTSRERLAMTVNDPILIKVFEKEGPHKQVEFQQKYIDILGLEDHKKKATKLQGSYPDERATHITAFSEDKRIIERDYQTSNNEEASTINLEKRVEGFKNRLISSESMCSKLLSKIESDDINMKKSEQKLGRTIQTINTNLLETKSYAAKIEENKKFIHNSFENLKILKKLASENDKLRAQLKDMTEKFQQISTNNNQQVMKLRALTMSYLSIKKYLLSKVIQLENEMKIKEEKNRQLEESLKGSKISPSMNGPQIKEMAYEMNMLRVVNENLNNKIEKQNSVIKELQKIIEYHENQKNVSIGNISSSNMQANTSLIHANKLPSRSPRKSILD